MEEELNDEELEERLYAMIHYADASQPNFEDSGNVSVNDIIASAPRSTVRRYWRTSGDQAPPSNNPFQKINTPVKDVTTPQNNNNLTTVTKPKEVNRPNEIKLKDIKSKEVKEEAQPSPETSIINDLSIFESPVSSTIKETIKILENDSANVFDVVTSDEDEVVEVALPPKPTITIESSDEDEVSIIPQEHSLKTNEASNTKATEDKSNSRKRSADGARDSASPVPSVVSSVSDEFIRGDCIAWNISSRRPDNPSFDFSLHGSDLVDTPSRKKKKKKNKERTNSTSKSTPTASGVITEIANVSPNTTNVTKVSDECFATPKNKTKNKKQKKTYSVSEHSIPNPDVYDSDSNQSIDNSKKNSYKVNEKSLPNPDVYESDSSQSELLKNVTTPSNDKDNTVVYQSDIPVSTVKPTVTSTPYTQKRQASVSEVVDLTDDYTDSMITINDSTIEENIVMANVTGFEESNDYDDDSQNLSVKDNKLGSTKVPAILSEDLDFNNLKGEGICKRRRYSLTSLRTEMEKFYNESWGGEDFNHKEIQKNMSRDKSLWEIDAKDRMPNPYSKRKVTCNYCNRTGHRDDSCRMKPPVCHMCGSVGHYEPRCPHKICVNCGAPNYMYSTICRNCAGWSRVTCPECRQTGHPHTHCPDLWRRYHDTTSNNSPLVEIRKPRKYNRQFCSGCTRRGHLVHSCRVSLPFSGLPINSPYVACYRPVHPPTSEKPNPLTAPSNPNPAAVTPKWPERNKRQSKSPTAHEGHANKKRMTSTSEATENVVPKDVEPARVVTPNRSRTESEKEKNQSATVDTAPDLPEAAPDFIPIPKGTNHDKRGQMIQDNEVSDTSDVITSARIYITTDILEKMKTADGEGWLKEKSQLHNCVVTPSDVNSFLNIKGKLADQEAFQAELRDWSNHRASNAQPPTQLNSVVDEQSYLTDNIPKNRNEALRKLNRAFESLKTDYGEPKHLFKELNYFRNNHSKLIKQKVVSPKKLSGTKSNINAMLKKLNTVLLGQAGLADGAKHLQKLHTLHEKLVSFRHKIIPLELRKQIGQHYHTIFNSVPRDDYKELIDKYYATRKVGKITKSQVKTFYGPTFPVERNHFNPKQNSGFPKPEHTDVYGQPPPPQALMVTKLIGKCKFYQRRIATSRPVDAVLKKTRLELMRKFHKNISALHNKEKVPSKVLKKMSRLQGQANLFLSNSNVM